MKLASVDRTCSRPDPQRGKRTVLQCVDLVNQLETEARNGKQGRLADFITRLDFVIMDELGYLPFAKAGGQPCLATQR